MSKDKILNISFGYWLLKQHAKFFHWLYYKKIYVKGLENIPKTGPVIFAPNHQNALMDPMAVLFTQFRYMVYLARADLFSKPMIARILYFLKILPIYRIRDGYSSLQNNDAIFKRTVNVLQNGMPLLLLPEGNHEGFRRLRPFKKGLARIAFMAEEQSDFTMGIKIVPVGIDYSDYVKCRQTLFIQYGAPISLNDYKQLYQDNQPRAIQKLTDDLYLRIKELMIHIGDEENYETYRQTRDIYLKRYMEKSGKETFDHPGQFESEQKLVDLIDKASSEDPEFILKLGALTSKYTYIIKKLNLRSHLLTKTHYPLPGLLLRSLLLVLFSPVFIAGIVFNILPFIIPVRISRKVKDIQFHSSFNYVLGLIVFPLFYLFYFFFPVLFIHGIVWKIMILVLLFISGNLALHWYIHMKKLVAKFRYNSLSGKGSLQELFELRDAVFDMLDRKI
jgi:1-acyl-sn-glycerol-3-phosphate acyltransferase